LKDEMRRSDKTLHSRSRRTSRGQAIAEFALILPLLLGLVGAGIDFARAFAGSITLESATRNAAEAAAYEALNLSEAQGTAREVVCIETQDLPGFVPGGGGDIDSCTNPTVTVTYSRDASAPGANSRYPLVTATVTTTLDFSMVVPWPFLPEGSWTLGTTQTFEILQGR
jgi:Flp pilus assembly protein TadG